MKILTILGEVLPVIGTIGLLGLWFYQQTEVEKRANILRQIASARGVFQNYQSNNALFNAIAITENLNDTKSKAGALCRYQMYNYELGLRGIEDVLSDSEKVGIPPAISSYNVSDSEINKAMDNVQVRLEKLQGKLEDKETAVKKEADASKRTYLFWYIVLSAASIIGAGCKVADKLITFSAA